MKPAKAIYQALENYMPNCSVAWIDAVNKYKDKLPQDLIIEAIAETAAAGVRNCKYFIEICERWLLSGYTTIDDIQNDYLEFRKRKQQQKELKDKARKIYIEKNMSKAEKVQKYFAEIDKYINMLEIGTSEKAI